MTLRDEVMRVVRMMRAGYCAPERANGIHGFYEGLLASYATELERAVSESAQELPEAVGTVGSMPGTDGFTMAAFEAAKVPAGTKLYTIPPGYALVPVEPTGNMLTHLRGHDDDEARLHYDTMLAAAPKHNYFDEPDDDDA